MSLRNGISTEICGDVYTHACARLCTKIIAGVYRETYISLTISLRRSIVTLLFMTDDMGVERYIDVHAQSHGQMVCFTTFRVIEPRELSLAVAIEKAQ